MHGTRKEKTNRTSYISNYRFGETGKGRTNAGEAIHGKGSYRACKG